jgi:hypothetical protein
LAALREAFECDRAGRLPSDTLYPDDRPAAARSSRPGRLYEQQPLRTHSAPGRSRKKAAEARHTQAKARNDQATGKRAEEGRRPSTAPEIANRRGAIFTKSTRTGGKVLSVEDWAGLGKGDFLGPSNAADYSDPVNFRNPYGKRESQRASKTLFGKLMRERTLSEASGSSAQSDLGVRDTRLSGDFTQEAIPE